VQGKGHPSPAPHPENQTTAVYTEELTHLKTAATLWWCLPSLGGFALFFFSFPIDRRMPFWPRLTLAEIYGFWFLAVAPVTTMIGAVLAVKGTRGAQTPRTWPVLVWAAITVCFLANMLVLLGLWAAFLD
jgi:hypothetical protein